MKSSIYPCFIILFVVLSSLTSCRDDSFSSKFSIDIINIDYQVKARTQPVTLKNTGKEPLTWNATKSDDWIVLSEVSGTINGSLSAVVDISVNRAGLLHDKYSGTVIFLSNGVEHIINIDMTVSIGIDKIAFTRWKDGDTEIFTMNFDGSSQQQLTTNNNIIDRLPNISFDGHDIYFASSRNGEYDIFRMSINGDEVTQISGAGSPDLYPKLSPDGLKVLYQRGNDALQVYELFVMDNDGSNLIKIASNPDVSLFQPTWTPDGNKILFVSTIDGDAEIYMINADGSNQTQLTSNSSHDTWPSVSYDGSSIVFDSNREGNWDIFKMNIDGSNQTRLTYDYAADGNPCFGPTGDIAFTSWRDGDAEIFVMSSDGTNLRQLTDNAVEDNYPDW